MERELLVHDFDAVLSGGVKEWRLVVGVCVVDFDALGNEIVDDLFTAVATRIEGNVLAQVIFEVDFRAGFAEHVEHVMSGVFVGCKDGIEGRDLSSLSVKSIDDVDVFVLLDDLVDSFEVLRAYGDFELLHDFRELAGAVFLLLDGLRRQGRLGRRSLRLLLLLGLFLFNRFYGALVSHKNFVVTMIVYWGITLTYLLRSIGNDLICLLIWNAEFMKYVSKGFPRDHAISFAILEQRVRILALVH